MADDIRPIHPTDGSDILDTRAVQDVLETIREGDVATGRELHRHRATHLVLHRCRDLHTDEDEH